MELIKGNLFVIITIFGTFAFIWIWSDLSNIPFEGVFSFAREKNRKKQLLLGGKIIAGVSVVCYAIYGLCVYLFHIPIVSIWGLALPVLYMLYGVYRLSAGVVKKNFTSIAADLMLLLCIPFGVVAVIFILKIKVDAYCGYLSIAMLFFSIWAAYNNRKIWRRGDL